MATARAHPTPPYLPRHYYTPGSSPVTFPSEGVVLHGWTGTYFVTLRAKEPGPIFDIPELPAILRQEWEALPKRFPNLTLDEFVIMPDHIHFILRLEGNVEHAPTLGSVIGAYKSLTTVAWLRHIQATNMECSARCWQRDYFEHIIRDAQELELKRHYIRNNPLKLKTSNADEPRSIS